MYVSLCTALHISGLVRGRGRHPLALASSPVVPPQRAVPLSDVSREENGLHHRGVASAAAAAASGPPNVISRLAGTRKEAGAKAGRRESERGRAAFLDLSALCLDLAAGSARAGGRRPCRLPLTHATDMMLSREAVRAGRRRRGKNCLR